MTNFKKFFLAGIGWKFLFYVSSFLLNVFIARKLGAAYGGQFYYLLNNLFIAVLVISLGIDAAVTYYNGAGEIQKNKLFTLSILFCVIAGILFAIVYWLAIHFNLIYYTEFAIYIWLYVTGSLALNIFNSFYYSEHRHLIPNLIATLCNVAAMFLLFTNAGNTFIKSFLLINFIAAIVMIALMLTDGAKFESFTFKKLIKTGFVKFAIQSFILSLLFALLLRCDYWIVEHYCSAYETGNYLQASKLVQLVIVLPSLASYTLFPLIVQSITNADNIENKLIRVIRIYIFLSLLICIAIAIAGNILFPFLYGSTFTILYFIFLLLMPGIIALAATYPLTPYFSAKKLISINLYGMLLSIIILVIADFILVPKLQAMGAAIGSSLGYCTYLFYLLHHFKKQIRFKYSELIDVRKFIAEIKSATKTNFA